MKNQKVFFICFSLILILPLMVFSQGKYLTTIFQEVNAIPEGKALVYVFRPSAFSGSAVHYTVKANDTAICPIHLYNGSYMVYFAQPGILKVSAEVAKEQSAVMIEVKPGLTYFIKGTIRTGTWVGRPYLEEVSVDQGKKEIRKCKLLKDCF